MALLLLVAMMLISLAGIRGSGLQERMGANLYDRQLAFQAAESALREGETRLVAALGTVSRSSSPPCSMVRADAIHSPTRGGAALACRRDRLAERDPGGDRTPHGDAAIHH